MRVLIPELADDAATVAAALAAQGHEVVAIPVITAAPIADTVLNLTGAQAFLVASPVAARALAARVGVRTFPVFADSAVTADVLRRLGFKQVEAANDARELANLVGSRLKPATGALIHPCAAGTPSSVTPVLTNMGFAVRDVPLYTLVRIDAAPPELRAALSTDAIDAAVFTTAEAARALVTVLQRGELNTKARGISAVAANAVVAAPLRGLDLRGITIPTQGDDTGLAAAVTAIAAERIKAAEAAAREQKRLETERAATLAEKERQKREAAEAAERERKRLEAERATALAAEEERQKREAAEVAERERKRLEAEREAAAAAERERKRLDAERAAALAAEEERRKREAAEAAERERKRLEAEREAAAAAERERKRLDAERAAALAAEEEHRKREATEVAERGRKRLEAEREAAAAAEREQKRLEAERAALAAEEERRKREAAEAVERERHRLEAEREAAAAAERERKRLEAERAAALAADEVRRKRAAAEAAERERKRLDAERTAALAAEEERRKREAAEAAERERKRLEEEREAAAAAEREQKRLEAERAATLAAEDERRKREAVEAAEQERKRLEAEREAAAAAEREQKRLAAEHVAALAAEEERRKREAAEIAERERKRLLAEQAAAAQREQEQREAKLQAARMAEEEARRAAEAAKRERQERERLEAQRQKAEREALIAAQHERDRTEAARAAEQAARRAQQERETAEAAERERQRIAAAFADSLAARQAQKDKEAAEVARREYERRETERERKAALARAEAERLDALRQADEKAAQAHREVAARQRQEQIRQAALITDAPVGESSGGALSRRMPLRREPLMQRAGRWLQRRKSQDQEPRVTVDDPAVGDVKPTGVMFHTPPNPIKITATDTANLEKPKQNDPPPSSAPELTVPLPPPSARLAPPPPEIVPVLRTTPPDAMTQDHDTPVPENVEAPAVVEGAADPALRGRAARLQAEDAADAVRAPRWRGFADTPENAPSDKSPAFADETTSDTPHTADETPKRSVRMDVILFLVLVLVVAAGGYVLYPRLAALHRGAAPVADINDQSTSAASPQNSPTAPVEAPAGAAIAPNTAPSDAVGNQATQMAALTARVATLETALGNTAHLDELNRRLTALEAKSADAASVLALADRVSALESASKGAIAAQTSRVALVLAIAQWRDAVAEGRPFALELESVKALAGRAAEPLTGLDDARFTAHAQAGIATTALLRERFDDTAASVVRAAAVPGGFNGFWGRSVERMMSIITIRRVDGLVEGNSPSAILARAGAFLKDGNLAAAVTEMEQLNGSAAAAAQPWLDEAHARVAAEQAVAAATSTALGGLATLPNAQSPAAPASRDAAPTPQ